MKKVIISGSSRKNGDTNSLVHKLVNRTNWNHIDLNDYNIGYYKYDNDYIDDDYIELMKKIINDYDTFIFITPVYWYSMSGIMKVFFDRITDLLTVEKELGRKLKGIKMAVVSCSYGNNLGDAFWLPFSQTANYLGMNYLGDLHTIVGNKIEEDLDDFIQLVE